MQRSIVSCKPLTVLLVLFAATPAAAHVIDKVWQRADYVKYGFSMLMPSVAHVADFESEFEDGWVTLRGNMEGAFFLGLASANVDAAPADLDALRAKLADLPEQSWQVIDEDADTSGWKWYRTFRTSVHGDSFFGGYGTGARGSYVFLVKTSDADFATHYKGYEKWFESITLDE